MATTTKQDKPKVTLYWLEKSRSHRILWLLEELDVPYELKTFKRGKDLLAPPELKKIHPLGKSPVISIDVPGQAEPLVIAESGNIVEWLVRHYGRPGQEFVPREWQEGKEGAVGGETAEFARYRYFMHYAEASLMPFLVFSLVVNQLKNAPVPFFIKPILRIIGGRIESDFLNRNLEGNFAFLEEQLRTTPGGGDFFTGSAVTGADVMLIFPLEAAFAGKIAPAGKYPKLEAWVERIHARPAYKAAIAKVEQVTGEKFSMEY